ncbi:MAG: HAMP domain-containing histidine kinase [Planctomycetota bacterium]|nr:MAG: HAMP domain-containing histidine kinase [Planctomycetota bacterium]
MKSKGITSSGYGQLRWVILLLSIAVILPTVCLLWFIAAAVRNERLAARQKLINVYGQYIAERNEKREEAEALRIEKINDHWERADGRAEDFFISVIRDRLEKDVMVCEGLVVVNGDGERIFPTLATDTGEAERGDLVFQRAQSLEFVDRNYTEAFSEYSQKARTEDEYIRFKAILGQVRTLVKSGKRREAIRLCREFVFDEKHRDSKGPAGIVFANAHILLANLLIGEEQVNKALLQKTLGQLLFIIDRGRTLPTDQKLFLRNKVYEIARSHPGVNLKSPYDLDHQRISEAEGLSIRVAESYPDMRQFLSWPEGGYQLLDRAGADVYGFRHGLWLIIRSEEQVLSELKEMYKRFESDQVSYRIVSNTGEYICGVGKPEREVFVKSGLGKGFPAWQIELYFKDGDIFESAASKQVALYTWSGALVIILILAAGGFAGRAVGKQIRLNRLKNDFIATVSHELKTPLASMRVLVDTLLEGNYKDQKQATEYLQLTSKENERLSRLIDNFLTFSRMERNKQTFEMMKVSPAAIARDAAEAVGTKFNDGRCKFDISIDENLPEISADHDAMVTVLVNLLDNAYKYSYDDRQIKLRVFTEGGSVCFEVADNGAGMSRRAAKKIFKRFYQVDRSLSRGSGGCGLGLSIVKFIVDAHKGTISVYSKAGKGSTFTVKLPASKHER